MRWEGKIRTTGKINGNWGRGRPWEKKKVSYNGAVKIQQLSRWRISRPVGKDYCQSLLGGCMIIMMILEEKMENSVAMNNRLDCLTTPVWSSFFSFTDFTKLGWKFFSGLRLQYPNLWGQHDATSHSSTSRLCESAWCGAEVGLSREWWRSFVWHCAICQFSSWVYEMSNKFASNCVQILDKLNSRHGRHSTSF